MRLQSSTKEEVLAEREYWDSRAAPSAEYRDLRDALIRRQAVGGVGPVAANDNQAWPLAQWLRKDDNDVLLAVAERYRAVYDAAHTEVPIVGAMPDDTYAVEQKHSVNRKTGVLKRNGPKRGKNAPLADDGSYKVIPLTDAVRAEIDSGTSTFKRKPAARAMRRWNGDRLINAAIDSRGTLYRLQRALGPLIEPFEDAVLHGETLAAIGEGRGAGTKSAGTAGRVLVVMGLEVVQREFREMDREDGNITPE